MLKHLQTISQYKVEYVTENEFYDQKDNIEQFMKKMLQKKFGIQPPVEQQQEQES